MKSTESLPKPRVATPLPGPRPWRPVRPWVSGPAAVRAGLLKYYACEELTLNQVLARLDAQVYHVLCHSWNVRPFPKSQFLDLLEQPRT